MTQEAIPPRTVQRGSCWGADGVYYPASVPEEQKVPVTDAAHRLVMYLYMALNHLFQHRDDAYVGGDQFFYWVPGDWTKCAAPDSYVIFGVPKLPLRSVIRMWEEETPAFVAEVSNKDCRREDREHKFQVYRDVLRIPEYLIYDMDTDELLFYWLVDGQYVLQQPDEQGRVYSRELNAWFGPDSRIHVRVYDAVGEPLPWSEELFQQLQDAQDHGDILTRIIERREREAAELRLRLDAERQRAEEQQRRVDEERRRVEEADRRAEAERQRAEAERQRADMLAAELERLRRERDG
jgi:Uma2 family endonuclease